MFAYNNPALNLFIANNIPKDFNWKQYMALNPDLSQSEIDDEKSCQYHYVLYGQKENRKYQYAHLIDVDGDFDYKFYLSEYPDVQKYYQHELTIPLEQKLFHHYTKYGKFEGRYKNLYEYNNSFNRIQNQLSNLNYNISLQYPTNNLQGIYLLTTNKEIACGRYSEFIGQLIYKTQDISICNEIDFNIVINKDINIPNIHQLKSLFSKVNVVNLDMSEQDDIYLSDIPKDYSIPKYGLKSGPNIAFFETMRHAYTKYDTILLMETDCILYDLWLTRIYNYIKYANGFLISGATYDGNVFMKAESAMLTHINGGTAIYATKHPALRHLITILEDFLVLQIKNNMPGLAYDYALKLLIDYQINHNNDIKNDAYKFWHFINRHYIPNKLIGNCCTKIDANIDICMLQNRFNFAIVHKKI
jgi:hypothetical protein